MANAGNNEDRDLTVVKIEVRLDRAVPKEEIRSCVENLLDHNCASFYTFVVEGKNGRQVEWNSEAI